MTLCLRFENISETEKNYILNKAAEIRSDLNYERLMLHDALMNVESEVTE